jgi:transposase-like protein
MGQRRKLSAEYKREAVAMLESPGVTVRQIAVELGIGATVLGRWRRELCQESAQAFRGNGRPRDEDLALLRRELARVTKGAGFFARSGSVLRERVAMTYRMIQRCRDASHPADVPVFAGLAQRVLWLGNPTAECAGPGQCTAVGANPYAVCRPRRGRRESAHVGRPALHRSAVWDATGGGAADASSRTPGRAAAAAVTEKTVRGPSQCNPQSSGAELSCHGPNTKWVTDIIYIRTTEHWLYLCIVLDWYSGLVVGWSMSPRQDRQLVVQAGLMALRQRPAQTPVILHSDRGCQFTSEEYQQFLESHQVVCSMSAVGRAAPTTLQPSASSWCSNANA